ncbi:hypothetical protein D8666_06555 [Ochrobactrum soli]|uniref:Uncharacterized protein n=2 Tax=Ochrobactrum TaxID=528 RepID=A0ABD5JX16_9HYPH|nr:MULTISPECIES: hypothetical protein [Brucella]RRD27661.1 hypothetical protein ECB98_00970 [Brucellaceae bacterium VT-16-1752]WHT41493.1 hypothetical protein QLQ11_08735 [Ochrobactrum sp. SSR]MDX4074763.1 hypothetical protein [Brucella sp. NBRC 113783]RLL74970.1 hypothetical protein D8666_06555 [[Ochrobactrum] soli]TNV11139.1 hypothetical protein FIC94_19120 [[Ochrobactrum] teleogrylli]
MGKDAADASTYRPRAAWFDGLTECGPATIKLNIIEADPSNPLAEAAVGIARRQIANAAARLEALPHLDAGFAILHQGEESLWLLLHWWLEGGIATEMLWQSELGDEIEFMPAQPLLMACVWELGIIDFERRAWMETAMSGKPIADYLARTLPRGTV